MRFFIEKLMPALELYINAKNPSAFFGSGNEVTKYGFFNGYASSEKTNPDLRTRFFHAVPLSPGVAKEVRVLLDASQPENWVLTINDRFSAHLNPLEAVALYKKAIKSVGRAAPSETSRLLIKSGTILVLAFLAFTIFISSRDKAAPAQPMQIGAAPSPLTPLGTEALAPMPPQIAQLVAQQQQLQQTAALSVDPTQTPIQAPVQKQAPFQLSEDSKITPQELKVLSGAKSAIEFGKGASTVYVFSDPNCPHCRNLEKNLKSLPDGIRLVVFPVAYQEHSLEAAAGVICSSDKKGAWSDLLLNGKKPGSSCPDGIKSVQANNKIFESMRLGSTPSIVSVGGYLFTGALSPEQIQALAKI